MASGLTPRLPLTRATENDFVLITTYKELVRQNFKNLLLTNPGERVMDADFGIGLNRFLFEMEHPHVYSNIASRIDEQIERYLPYIEIVNLTFDSAATNPNMGANSLFIGLEYKIKPLRETDRLDLTLPDN